MNVTRCTGLITDALDKGYRDVDQVLFLDFARSQPDDVSDLVVALGKARHIPTHGVIYVGPAWALFSNPLRDDWIWRCGTHHPCVGVMYKSEVAARRAAEKHAAKTGAEVREVNR